MESLENRDRYDYYSSLAMTEKEAYPSPIGNQILLSRLETALTEFGTWSRRSAILARSVFYLSLRGSDSSGVAFGETGSDRGNLFGISEKSSSLLTEYA
jgi:hypothetical protein